MQLVAQAWQSDIIANNCRKYKRRKNKNINPLYFLSCGISKNSTSVHNPLKMHDSPKSSLDTVNMYFTSIGNDLNINLSSTDTHLAKKH